MGANIVRRLQRGGHACVADDVDGAMVERLVAQGLPAVGSLKDFPARLATSRVVWVMVPAEVLTAALYARLRSRQEHTFAERVLSAMRFKFGGHVEPPGGTPHKP
jgi:6-phosphogluconate dehydrogenase (decarboxylating)